VAQKSSYLRYLPPVLWQNEPDLPEFSLGAVLRIFEKVLTGIDDDVDLVHGDHRHEAVTAVVAGLHRLFDPWQTPPEFLPWLASWVGLEFPTLQGEPLWDEYQQRKATAEITRIYRLRGLPAGLNRYLDLFAVGQTRPRVTLDDGRRLLMTRPRPEEPAQLAPVAALVSQGPVLAGSSVVSEGLVRPWCVAPAPGGGCFVGDIGVPPSIPIPLRSRVWRVSAAGRHDLTDTPPRPQPLAPDSLPLSQVVALAVRPAMSGQPETLYILDRPGKLYALPAPYLGGSATLVTSLATSGTTLWPVAMAVDTNGDLLVLDRGDGRQTPNPPKVITVHPSPLTVTRRSLTKVIEPLSLIVQPDGRLVIGDGGSQEPTDASQLSGNLVQVDRIVPASWTETLLLPTVNPLVAPTGLARSGNRLYVLDAGVKPFAPPLADPFVLNVAEPAGVYAVDLAATPVTVIPATESGHLVFPTGMAASDGRLVICDPGQPEVAGLIPVYSRLLPHRFDVVVHFAGGRLPTDPDARATVQRQVVGTIRRIVEQQKPAHALWNLVTAI
jgi:phage tail-like protein